MQDALERLAAEAAAEARTQALALAKTELMLAAETGDLDGLRRALAKGAPADTRQRDCDGYFEDENGGATSTAQRPSLAHGPSARGIAQPKHSAGRTVLLVALEHGHVNTAAHLLQSGATVDLADDVDGFTPLMAAAKSLAVLKSSKLLDRLLGLGLPGAEPTPVDVATPRGWTAATYAAAFGREPYLRRLVAAGASPNAPRLKCPSPLTLAAKHGHLACVQYLCSPALEVDLLHRDGDGRQAKFWAQRGDHKAIVETISKAMTTRGAPTDPRNKGKESRKMSNTVNSKQEAERRSSKQPSEPDSRRSSKTPAERRTSEDSLPARRTSRQTERRKSRDRFEVDERRASKDSVLSEALSDAAPVKRSRAKKSDDDLDELRPAELVQ
mmetsp:Transcript_22678/g.68058  ORF Transcript_22678/g.68058 Transcript_22678/m.68058 type:complete len:385 (+) Transcript_22678:1-1155(+)